MGRGAPRTRRPPCRLDALRSHPRSTTFHYVPLRSTTPAGKSARDSPSRCKPMQCGLLRVSVVWQRAAHGRSRRFGSRRVRRLAPIATPRALPRLVPPQGRTSRANSGGARAASIAWCGITQRRRRQGRPVRVGSAFHRRWDRPELSRSNAPDALPNKLGEFWTIETAREGRGDGRALKRRGEVCRYLLAPAPLLLTLRERLALRTTLPFVVKFLFRDSGDVMPRRCSPRIGQTLCDGMHRTPSPQS